LIKEENPLNKEEVLNYKPLPSLRVKIRLKDWKLLRAV